MGGSFSGSMLTTTSAYAMNGGMIITVSMIVRSVFVFDNSCHLIFFHLFGFTYTISRCSRINFFVSSFTVFVFGDICFGRYFCNCVSM